jgi:hypothetical protein
VRGGSQESRGRIELCLGYDWSERDAIHKEQKNCRGVSSETGDSDLFRPFSMAVRIGKHSRSHTRSNKIQKQTKTDKDSGIAAFT